MANWQDAGNLTWDQHGLLTFLILLVVESLFIWLAAKFTGEREGFFTAFATALVGAVLAGLVLFLVHGVLGLLLAVLVWGAVAASFYRTRLVKGILIGLLAWLLFWVTLYVLALARA